LVIANADTTHHHVHHHTRHHIFCYYVHFRIIFLKLVEIKKPLLFAEV
jgi:hypothetical protein